MYFFVLWLHNTSSPALNDDACHLASVTCILPYSALLCQTITSFPTQVYKQNHFIQFSSLSWKEKVEIEHLLSLFLIYWTVNTTFFSGNVKLTELYTRSCETYYLAFAKVTFCSKPQNCSQVHESFRTNLERLLTFDNVYFERKLP